MVQDLVSNNNKNGNVTVDLGSLGGALNKPVGGNGEKQEVPNIVTPVEAVVLSAELKRDDNLSYNRQDPSKKYYRSRIIVTTAFEFDGEKKVIQTNYAGLRLYPKLDQNGNPIINQQTGQPEIERLWANSPESAQTSDFSKLLGIAIKSEGQLTYGGFLEFLSSKPACMVATEQRAFGGKTFDKIFIQEFVK